MVEQRWSEFHLSISGFRSEGPIRRLKRRGMSTFWESWTTFASGAPPLPPPPPSALLRLNYCTPHNPAHPKVTVQELQSSSPQHHKPTTIQPHNPTTPQPHNPTTPQPQNPTTPHPLLLKLESASRYGSFLGVCQLAGNRTFALNTARAEPRRFNSKNRFVAILRSKFAILASSHETHAHVDKR